MAKQNAQAATPASTQSGAPILKLILGVILILMFLLATMLQIQTSEAFILNGQAVGLSANWAILKQPFHWHKELSVLIWQRPSCGAGVLSVSILSVW